MAGVHHQLLVSGLCGAPATADPTRTLDGPLTGCLLRWQVTAGMSHSCGVDIQTRSARCVATFRPPDPPPPRSGTALTPLCLPAPHQVLGPVHSRRSGGGAGKGSAGQPSVRHARPVQRGAHSPALKRPPRGRGRNCTRSNASSHPPRPSRRRAGPRRHLLHLRPPGGRHPRMLGPQRLRTSVRAQRFAAAAVPPRGRSPLSSPPANPAPAQRRTASSSS